MKKEFEFDEIAIGTDAEFFFVNANGEPVSTEGWLGGRKGSPILCDGGGYLEDCVTVELNVDPVPYSEGWEKFAANIKKCIDAVSVKARTLELSASIVPELLFDKAQLKSLQARESGCSPTYDAWDLRKNPTKELKHTDLRFAAGDIHVSWPDKDRYPYSRVNVARMMDIIIGMNEIIYTERNVRSDWFGIAGSHRPTSYGVEYKAVSNFWLKSDKFIRNVFESSRECVLQAARWENSLALDGSKSLIKDIRQRWDKEAAKTFLHHELGMRPWS